MGPNRQSLSNNNQA